MDASKRWGKKQGDFFLRKDWGSKPQQMGNHTIMGFLNDTWIYHDLSSKYFSESAELVNSNYSFVSICDPKCLIDIFLGSQSTNIYIYIY